MNQYYMLIKNKFIDFDKLVIEKYHMLGLNEVDAIILIKLQKLLDEGEKKLDASLLAPTMSLTATTISKRIVDLVKNGFITLSLSNIDASEVFCLDETYKRFANIIADDEKKEINIENSNLVKKVATLIEQEFNKVLGPNELETIKHWVFIDKYSYEKIEETVFKCVKFKKMNVSYVDVMLTDAQIPKESQPKSNLQELFKNVYRKK